MSTNNYSDLLCKELSPHLHLGHFLLITENSSGFLHVSYWNQKVLVSRFFRQKQEKPEIFPTPQKDCFVDCRLSTVVPLCLVQCAMETRDSTGTLFTQSSFLFTKSLCRVCKAFFFFHCCTCRSNSNHQPMNSKISSQFLMGEVGGVPIRLVQPPEDD